MKILSSILVVVLFATLGCSSDDDTPVYNVPTPTDPTTVIYLIRHAEKADDSANPNLSAAGLQRAQDWAELLQDVTFDAIYSTDFNRTRQTATPLADENGLDLIIYDPFDFSLVNVAANHVGQQVMIVGHSNTTPDLINAFLGEAVYPQIEETQYGNLYKITIGSDYVQNELTVHN